MKASIKKGMMTKATVSSITPEKGSTEAPYIPLQGTVGATATNDAAKSFLSSSKYGYDYVVATTQESINSTMHQHMAVIDSPIVEMYYVLDDNGNPQEISKTDLMALTGNIDPFNIPDGAAKDSADVKAVAAASFMYAFKAKIGLPPGYTPLTVPNVVTLGRDTKSVHYNLLCSEFQIASATYGPRGIMSWLNKSQQSGDAWIFSSLVDLVLTEDSNYGNLPVDVQAQIQNLGPDAFSIQQLLFDLDNATLATVPTLSGIAQETDLTNALNKVFVGAYFAQLQKQGQPVLNYTIKEKGTSASTLSLIDLNFHIQPYLSQDPNKATAAELKANTLCYLCAADKDTSVNGQEFGWNWVDAAQASQYDGVISINRDTFRNYIEGQLLENAKANSYLAYVNVYPKGVSATYEWNLSSGQNPSITRSQTTATANNSTVLTYAHSSSAYDEAGMGGALGAMRLVSEYSMTVEFRGNTIIIKQRLMVFTYIRNLQTSVKGSVVDKTITDTYTMAINQTGGITFNLSSNTEDHPETLSTDWFTDSFTGVNSLADSVKTWASNITSIHLTSIPLEAMQKFIFPGGNTFNYNDIFFSDNQDLVTHITYTNPSF